MKKNGIIILSHCGFSFTEDLCDNIKAMGLAAYVLTSKPLKAEQTRLEILSKQAVIVCASKSHALTETDVNDFIDELLSHDHHVLACITVWEGYRHIMAKTNIKLNAHDLLPSQVELLRDKFYLRKKLRKLGLSNVKTTLLSQENFESFRHSKQNIFIKPRLGLASYGAFSLKKDDKWSKVVEIQKNITKDKEYQSAFGNEVDFVAEDYIDGREYSFEIIAWGKTPYIIAIHEKIDLQKSDSTTLESACVSPSISLNKQTIHEASSWMKKIFLALDINVGCYHVEAKYCNKKWEIIEINPRVGGAFISQSVALQLESDNLLSLWIKTLLSRTDTGLQDYLKSISTENDQFCKRKNNTFFRVYFADSIGTIRFIHLKRIQPEPENIKILIEPGLNITSLDKEIFLAQALWKLDNVNTTSINNLLKSSRELLEITYE